MKSPRRCYTPGAGLVRLDEPRRTTRRFYHRRSRLATICEAKMGEAKRRQQADVTDKAARQQRLENQIVDWHSTCQGGLKACECYVIRPEWVRNHCTRLEGEALLSSWVAAETAAPSPRRCLSCNAVLPPLPGAFVMLLPAVERPQRSLTMGVCRSCTKKDDDELRRRSFERLHAAGLVTHILPPTGTA